MPSENNFVANIAFTISIPFVTDSDRRASPRPLLRRCERSTQSLVTRLYVLTLTLVVKCYMSILHLAATSNTRLGSPWRRANRTRCCSTCTTRAISQSTSASSATSLGRWRSGTIVRACIVLQLTFHHMRESGGELQYKVTPHRTTIRMEHERQGA